jgi:hypothetical protein
MSRGKSSLKITLAKVNLTIEVPVIAKYDLNLSAAALTVLPAVFVDKEEIDILALWVDLVGTLAGAHLQNR